MSSVDVAASEQAAAGARSNADKALSNLFGRSEVRPAKNSEAVQHGAAKDGDNPNGYDLTNPNLHYGTRTDVEVGNGLADRTSTGPSVNSNEPFVESSIVRASAERVNQAAGDTNPIAVSGQTDESQPHAFDVSGQSLASVGHAPAAPSGTHVDRTIEAPTGAVSGTQVSGDHGDNPITVSHRRSRPGHRRERSRCGEP